MIKSSALFFIASCRFTAALVASLNTGLDSRAVVVRTGYQQIPRMGDISALASNGHFSLLTAGCSDKPDPRYPIIGWRCASSKRAPTASVWARCLP